MGSLPHCLSARPLVVAASPGWPGPGRGPFLRGGARRRNAAVSAGNAGRRVGLRRSVASAVDVGVGEEEEEVVEAVVMPERYALGGACRVLAGMPAPLGATALDGGVNFAVYSAGASAASLCLFTHDDLEADEVTEEVPLDPLFNRTGNVWHVFIEGELHNMMYGYRFDGMFAPHCGQYFDASNVVVDPYAKAVISRGEYGVPGPGGDCWPQMAGMIPLPYSTFDWQGDLPLRYPQKDLVIYEMHLRGFTNHSSSNVEHPGTYIGAISKLDYLKELGVNCVELMPCHEFNELEYFSCSSKMNFWGYSTINFFSPMIRYSSGGIRNCGRDAINEFKTFVREAHKRGIEVIMDVVFNHTAEGNEKGPILSFRGIDNSTYYMLAPKGEFYNYSGCGNTFNCNHPVVREFIVDCLRYWVTEMHVDGFRFDLASIMTRGCSLWDPVNVYGGPVEGDMTTTGTPLATPPLIDMISNDPILGDVKYRDIVRQFIKGTDGFAGGFAECLCGSPHLYQAGGRKPWHSINFVCAHDGFTLADLVTYNKKYNSSNGEDNRDGENHNLSWNCGEEGEFAGLSVKRLRKRQMRNFFVSLMVSQGVPMFYMGDEYGHTKGGNNNTYCHDHYVNYFRWDKKEESSDLQRFCSLMTKFRKQCESLGLADFPTAQRLHWHGHQPGKPDWSETSRFVAFSMKDETKGEIYVAFNASHLPTVVGLPERPGYRWEPLVDTGKPAPYDFLTDDLPDRAHAVHLYSHFLNSNLYPMLSYSSIILELQPDD
uniref:Glycosyl hydrolase family 13 catalytic domain-containing protein n=1 Tax=Oryza punctata TaxID=4537 RepID=A0A0E0LWZ8_ORYPU